jgi:hypothetical protein
LDADSGQTLRQKPGTTSHRNGRTGMISFQRTNSPVSASRTSVSASAIAPSSVPTRISCHVPTGTRVGICV